MMKFSKRDSKKMIKEMARLYGLSVSEVREQIQDKIIAVMDSDDPDQQAEFKQERIHRKSNLVLCWISFVNVNIKFTKSVSLIFTSSGCYDHHPQSWISYPLFDMTFL